ncbi:phage tail protein I [Novosphingobium rosa]|uniref:phage tail protein I n=1 Tax=Novosphingobium rosa TaxID=76978 RepID=UPI00082CFB73|nr:phage tail protein I [Novosphingobium rosa]
MTDLATILPPNATELELMLDGVAQTRVDGIDTPLRKLWSAQDCPENLLPWLAWTLGVESWDPTMPLALRRARVAQAIPIHRRKGTVSSIRDVIASYGGIAVMTEWWQQVPKSIPHSFTLSIALGGQATPPTADFINGMIADVTRAKPLRSFFTLTLALNLTATLGLVGAARPASFARLTCREA